MNVADFDFELPADLVAQEPPIERGTTRLLTLDRRSGALQHAAVRDLPTLLQPDDLLVVNDTRVFPARLIGRRVPTGGAVECLLINPLDASAADDQRWEALMHPGQKLQVGSRVIFEADAVAIHGEVLERRFFGRRVVRLWIDPASKVSSLDQAVDAIGHMPLPPYIKREDSPADRRRYQTVFAAPRGSVAAPTAGLHFTEQILDDLRRRKIEIATITLHVGYGTFQPVRVARVEDHRLEAEHYSISGSAASAINRALDEGRRIIAVGTTTTRTLEAVARQHDGRLVAGSGTTDLFIFPGFAFRVVQGLMTNFHLPKSSLLMLVAAFAGRESVLAAYAHAVDDRYQFYSYGDAMLIL